MDQFIGHLIIAIIKCTIIAICMYKFISYIQKRTKRIINKLYGSLEEIIISDISDLSKYHGVTHCSFVPNLNDSTEFRFRIKYTKNKKDYIKIFHVTFSVISILNLYFVLLKYRISTNFFKRNDDKIEILINNKEFRSLLHNRLDEIFIDEEANS